ncbi:MAG: NADH-quinone oxidoreductase subunit C [Alphaproteobacteria bacterium]|nr:NADH-quinone oxidoreductase subunit C [Alphaproteobacteria bacterium]
MTSEPIDSANAADPKDLIPVLTLGQALQEKMPEAVESYELDHGELIVRVRKEGLTDVMAFLRDDPNCRFAQLMDICGVDYPERALRFDVVYQLLSLKYNMRARIKVATDDKTPIPSVSGLFNSAPWFEREAWDLFGIMFDGLADHRRILTDYGFDGHPLRKDFPLTGHVEVHYDDEAKRVVYAPVTLPQDFRVFDNLSPWEAMTDVQLPGDEKAGENPHMPKIGWQPVAKSQTE